MAKIDLHVHTNYSDGHYPPKSIVELALSKKLNSISITDHDTVDGFDEAVYYGKQLGIDVISGIELSCEVNLNEVHILGYFIDTKNSSLLGWINEFQNERMRRAEKIVSILQELGLNIIINDVKQLFPTKNLGRPHIAQTLVNLKLVPNFYKAFELYLSNDAPAFVPKYFLSISDAVNIIHEAGGLAFVAHPYKMDEAVLRDILQSSIDGIETVHPSHDKAKRKYYKKIVHDCNLLESGGSDFHGGSRNDGNNFGQYFITSKILDLIKNKNKSLFIK